MKTYKYLLPLFCILIFACKNAPERPDSVLSEGSKAAQQLQFGIIPVQVGVQEVELQQGLVLLVELL